MRIRLSDHIRRLLFFIVCVSAATSVIAQSALPKATNDSLWAVWNDASKHDTMRIMAMRDIAWDGYLFTQPDSAAHYAQMEYDFAEKANRKGGMADALNTLGSASYLTGNIDKAIEQYTQSMLMRREQGNRQAEAAALNNLGNIHFQKGNLEHALDNFSQSLSVMEQLGNTRGMAVTLNNMADVYRELGKFSEAIESYKRSKDISEKTKDLQGIAASLDNIGKIHRDRGNYPQAIENHLQSLKLQEQRGDSADIAGSFNHLALVYSDMGEDTIALAYHLRSLRFSEKSGYRYGEAKTLNYMGDLYYRQGNRQKALEYYQHSLLIRQEIEDVSGIATCLSNIGTIQFDQGDIITAISHFNQALDIQKQIGDRQGEALTRAHIGSVHLAKGEKTEALAEGKRALSIAQEVGDAKITRDAALLLYRSYKAMGQNASALELYELHITMRDSILSTENRKAVMGQRFRYEYKKKEALLVAEQEAKNVITETRIRNHRYAIFGVGGSSLLLLGLGLSGFLLFRQRQRNRALQASIQAKDDERNRLSRELHDGIASELRGLEMRLSAKAFESERHNLAFQLAELRHEVRNMSHDLAMPDMAHSSLPEMAHFLVGRWRGAGREIHLHIDPANDAKWKLPSEITLHIYRMLQEGIGNALAHTTAEDDIKVSLARTATQVSISIQNPHADELPDARPNGIGLKNIRERLDLLHGNMAFEKENGIAKLNITLPI